MPSSPSAARKRTPIAGAFLEGWRRVIRAPALTLGVLGATFFLALPLAIVLQGAMATHLGNSVEAERAAEGWNANWAAEFGAQAQGVSRTFTSEFLGFGGTLAIISDMLDRQTLNPSLAMAAAASIAVWIFLSGGLLDRLARGRPVGAAHFFAICGVFFVRFVRLGVFVGAAYWALFRWLHPWLFSTVFHGFTRDQTEERRALIVGFLLYLVFLAALALVNVIADFAKVRAVVEDRRSMLGALDAAWRFVRRRFGRVIGLYLLNTMAFLLILRIWLQVAPAASDTIWLALLVSQLYLLVRVWAKLAFMASEVVFFQGELAHAQYTAAPAPVWPDSPAAEAIDNLTEY